MSKWHNKFPKDWAESFTADLVYSDILLLLENWEPFRSHLMGLYKRPEETDGDCLSRLRKSWKHNINKFYKEYSDWRLGNAI